MFVEKVDANYFDYCTGCEREVIDYHDYLRKEKLCIWIIKNTQE